MGNWPHKHILTLANFSIKDYESVFEIAERFNSLRNSGTKKIHVNLVWPGVLGIQEFVCLVLIKHTEYVSKLHIF